MVYHEPLYNLKMSECHRLNFSMTMDYSPCTEREIGPFLKGSHISETRGVMPTKTGVHARDIDLYLHEFFEPIPIG